MIEVCGVNFSGWLYFVLGSVFFEGNVVSDGLFEVDIEVGFVEICVDMSM